MVEEEKTVTQVEKRQSSFLQQIPPKLMLVFVGIAVGIIVFPVPNKGVLLIGLFLLLIFFSKRKDTETRIINAKEARALVNIELKDLSKSGRIPPFYRYDVGSLFTIKSISGFSKYWFGGVTLSGPEGEKIFWEAKVWLAKEIEGFVDFKLAIAEVNGREQEHIIVPPLYKKMMKNITKTEIGRLLE